MRRRATLGTAVLAGAVVMAAGCSTSAGVDTRGGPSAPATTAATAPKATPSGSAPADQPAILAQYRAFFNGLTPLSAVTSSSVRRAELTRVAVDPELTQVLGGLAASQALGQRLYGEVVLHPVVKNASATSASVTDCQDTSHHGRLVSKTGHKVTVGHVDDLATVTMTRGNDDKWRVARVTYSPVGSCHAAS